MAKKEKYNSKKEEVIANSETQIIIEDEVQENSSKQEVQEKQNRDKSKKPNFFARIFGGLGKWFRGLCSEFKKIVWPSFGEGMRQTGVVFGLLIVFIVVLLGLNALCSWVFDVIFKQF